jgi:hypothetical protein
VLCGALTITVGAMSGCAVTHRRVVNDYGVSPCPVGAAAHLLSVDALQCWFTAPHGRWRIVGHDSHYAVLVVHVEALNVSDADAIARLFVATQHDAFSEILVYVQPESATGASKIRRVRWEGVEGFDVLDFTAEPR